ncbi:MAG: sigma-70 family RNA polymerase sigma factor, partial [Oscillospiraceae bacterium]|nr:sigma-70 family RNA polymerase sigma factor [Oscillospiraceae bacterium]
MDKQRADRIITEYLQKIYGFAIKKSYSYDEAEEICAEIIKQLYSSLLKAKEIINIEGYVWRISEHTYSKFISSKKKHAGISIDEIHIPFFEDYFFEAPDDEIKKLRQEVAFLTEKRRQIVYHFYYEDKSISVISREMGLPEGTVKWHLNKARIELKEAFSMERKIGKLGLSPITATSFGHCGDPGSNDGPEFYLGDKLNLNIVYSVYRSPKTKEEIAAELGLTLVYLEDKINFLEDNGFLVRTTQNRYTTFVNFTAEKYSLELQENKLKMQLQIAEILVNEYVPLVRKSVEPINDIYIPGGNRELFEAAAVFYGVSNKCVLPINKDLSDYIIKTTSGGEFIAFVNLDPQQSDPNYVPTLELPSYWSCGNMIRTSKKYPSVYSWSIDSRYSSREGNWSNNLTSDYEYLYEFSIGSIFDNAANAEKIARLKERRFLTEDNKINIMMILGSAEKFFAKIPTPNNDLKNKFANIALEFAMNESKNYPPQMRDLVICSSVGGFICNTVALMVMDILYKNGTFKTLSKNEKVTSNLLMFSDTLP